MSHWEDCKIELKCSINVLRRALQNIMPEWEQNIEVGDNLTAINKTYPSMSPPRPGFALVVRLDSSDIGFKQVGDTWVASYDRALLPGNFRRHSFDGAVIQEVAAMRTRALAEIKHYQVVTDTMEGGNKVIEFLEPLEPGAMEIQ